MSRDRKDVPDWGEIMTEEEAAAFRKGMEEWAKQVFPEEWQQPRPEAEVIDIKTRKKPG